MVGHAWAGIHFQEVMFANFIHQKVNPTPAFAAEVADMSEYLMSHLPESDLKQLVLLKLEGHTNEDVAELMKITRRTVQRKLERIRRIWLESAELPKPNQT